jgi:hypothetical protein
MGNDPSPHELLKTDIKSNWPNLSFQGVSPNGERIIFYDVPDEQVQASVWISSVDGERQWKVSDVDSRTTAGWISNSEIMIQGQLTERESTIPLMTLNPFTLQTKPLAALPDTVWFLSFFTLDDDAYALYYDPFYQSASGGTTDGFFLYSYRTGQSAMIFRWLDEERWVEPDRFTIYSQIRVIFNDNGLETMIIEKPYGMDLGGRLDLVQLSAEVEYSDVMKPIILPEGGPNMRLSVLAPQIFAIDRYDRFQAEPRSSQFYVLDLTTLTVNDYCLDRGHASPVARASIDRRFVAWTVYDLEGGFQNAKETLVLDLASGRIAKIPGVEFLGWVRLP